MNDTWVYDGSNSTRIATPHAQGQLELGYGEKTVRAAGTCETFTHCTGLIPMPVGPR